jgi:hypothetical protein
MAFIAISLSLVEREYFDRVEFGVGEAYSHQHTACNAFLGSKKKRNVII